jgi:cathepsin A (carboxypeptidase C)
LHYFFIDSLNHPDTDPIILVFNGGPGGPSTFLAFQLSQFTATSFSKTLTDFPDTWSRNASLLFIDNPAGVGFSYAERDVDWAVNDDANNRDLLKLIY